MKKSFSPLTQPTRPSRGGYSDRVVLSRAPAYRQKRERLCPLGSGDPQVGRLQGTHVGPKASAAAVSTLELCPPPQARLIAGALVGCCAACRTGFRLAGRWQRCRRHGRVSRSLSNPVGLVDRLHAMQFRAPLPPQVSGVRPAKRPSPSDRDYPLDTVVDRCLWHVGGTAGENDGAPTWRRRLPACLQGEARPRQPPHCGQAVVEGAAALRSSAIRTASARPARQD
jgi:hypothetical protein